MKGPNLAWLPGMRDLTTGERLGDDGRWRIRLQDYMESGVPRRRVPDFNDPATLGCMLALVRKAWGDPTGYVACNRHGDEWACIIGGRQFMGATEAEALVAALKAAPPKPGESS